MIQWRWWWCRDGPGAACRGQARSPAPRTRHPAPGTRSAAAGAEPRGRCSLPRRGARTRPGQVQVLAAAVLLRESRVRGAAAARVAAPAALWPRRAGPGLGSLALLPAGTL